MPKTAKKTAKKLQEEKLLKERLLKERLLEEKQREAEMRVLRDKQGCRKYSVSVVGKQTCFLHLIIELPEQANSSEDDYLRLAQEIALKQAEKDSSRSVTWEANDEIEDLEINECDEHFDGEDLFGHLKVIKHNGEVVEMYDGKKI